VIYPSSLPKGGGGEEMEVVVGDSFDEKVDAFKKKLILEAYDKFDKNQKKAAENLEMTYDQYRHFFRKYQN